MFKVYILQSKKDRRFYIGSTANLEKRFARHNNGGNLYTRPFRPFELVWEESYNTRAEAVRREYQIKSLKSKTAIQNLISRQKT